MYVPSICRTEKQAETTPFCTLFRLLCRMSSGNCIRSVSIYRYSITLPFSHTIAPFFTVMSVPDVFNIIEYLPYKKLSVRQICLLTFRSWFSEMTRYDWLSRLAAGRYKTGPNIANENCLTNIRLDSCYGFTKETFTIRPL